MFDKKVYKERRELLRKLVGSGVILLPGNEEAAMNYAANPYPFRQDSHFLYFFGIDKPGFMGLIDVDENRDYIFGEDFTLDDIIWMGPQPSVKELAARAGVNDSGNLGQLSERLDHYTERGRQIHFLPPYRSQNILKLEKLLGIAPSRIKKYASEKLIKAVVAQRVVKSADEIREIEKALDISSQMYGIIMENARPGVYEREIVGKIEGLVGSYGSHVSFPVILSVHGETLHNHFHGNRMKEGDLLVADSGAESPEHYASDITRTFPVGGKFTPRQRDIYNIVLEAELTAIKMAAPGKKYREVHLEVAAVIASGLKEVGLMKGDVSAAVEAGAHALFFPHGLGHMLGLDVHDLEDVGENYVGYTDKIKRSEQFGLAYLRFAREPEPGYVITVEPGIYFIPALIDKWESENRHPDFINYDKVIQYKDFGGIRIEDDILITETGCRVLGSPVPKTVEELEQIMG